MAFRKSISNILLYGPSGTGKTEGSQAIAEMLGLPYYTQTCSPDDDKFDILGQLMPNTGKGKTGDTDEACKALDIPTFSDVENDFKSSFMKLFGKEPGKLDSEADCYQEITKRLIEKNANDENDFVYIESELIQAIKHGGFCEIQEANIMMKPAAPGVKLKIHERFLKHFYETPYDLSNDFFLRYMKEYVNGSLPESKLNVSTKLSLSSQKNRLHGYK